MGANLLFNAFNEQAWITKDHDWILSGKIKLYFDMIMGDSFEIRGQADGGRLGPTLTVGPIIRLIRA